MKVHMFWKKKIKDLEEQLEVKNEVITMLEQKNCELQNCNQYLEDETARLKKINEKYDTKFSLKKLLYIITTPASKLEVKDGAIAPIKLIIKYICDLSAFSGYGFSFLLFWASVWAFVKTISWVTFTALLLASMISLLIVLISKLIRAAGFAIERTDDNTLIFGVAAFWFAFWPIIKDVIGFIKPYF